MLKNYIIIALRNLWKQKTISFINIFGLSISMSVCLLLIIIVTDQLSYDTFHDDSDRIYRVITDRVNQKDNNVWSTATTAYPLADKLKQHESVEHLTAIKSGFSGVMIKGNSEVPFSGLYTDNQFFDVFNFSLESGNVKEALSLPNSIILTKELANKIFDKANPINEVIELEGSGQFVVTGILAEPEGKSQITFEALASTNFLVLQESQGKLSRSLYDWNGIYSNYIYYKLKEGALSNDIEQVYGQATADNYDPKGEHRCEFKSQELGAIVMGPELSNAIGFTLPSVIIYFLSALAMIVLTLACLNYANLTTARALSRAKEIGLRKVIGARRRHIAAQFIIEAVLISLVAFVFADLISQYLHPKLNSFLSSQGAPISFDQVPYLYVIFVGFGIATGLVSGFFPSMILATTNPLTALKKSISLGELSSKFKLKGFSMRKVLIVAQFAFTIFFVITIVAVNRQMDYVMTKDHGFKVEGIVNVPLNGIEYQKLKNEFKKLSVVQHVSAASHFPARGTNYIVEAFKAGDADGFYLDYFGVDSDYIQSMELTLIAGRDFTANISKNESTIIINETAVEQLGYEEPLDAIGDILKVDSTDMEIIGVVHDYNYQRLDESIGPMALRNRPDNVNRMVVVVNSENKQYAIDQLSGVWSNLTNRPFEYTFFEDDMRMSYGHFEAIMIILGYITFIVISIACLGLLGMVMFHIQYRTKEIGVRKTLGANHKDILFVIGKSFFIMILIAYLIGGPLAYFVNDHWLTTYAYRIDFGIGIMLIGFVMVLLVVGLTISSQLYKAMNLNPVDSLRNE